MEKMQKLFIQKPFTLFALCLTMVLFSLATTEPVSAHGGRLHLPFDLPACTARVMVCEPSSTTFAPFAEALGDEELSFSASSIPFDERHCLDGTGVPRSCYLDGPFQYMPQNLALEKGSVTAALQLEAMNEIPCIDGTAGPFPCSNVDLLSFLPLDNIGGGIGNDIWGWTDPTTGGEYVIMGRRDGTSFVDISDPVNPVYLGNLPSEDGKTSIWRDIKVYKNHAFIVVDEFPGIARTHGMQIFDLTQLAAAATNTATLPISFSATTVYTETYGAHNLAINEESGFAYILGSRHSLDSTKQCQGGLHMVDVTTPTTPTFAGCFSDDGYTHDAQCVIYDGPDTTYQGNEICFNSNEDSLTIVDVTVKSSPVEIAKTYYLNFCSNGDVEDCNYDGGGGSPVFYTHQGWLTEDHTYFVQNDELDELGLGLGDNTRTYMWNVQDLDDPQYIGAYTATEESIDHNLYIRDQYIYEANYSSGLRILDASDIAAASLSEVAYFDTYINPTTGEDLDGLQSDGAWSSYPFFESGAVAVSTIGQGLFILQPSLDAAVQIYMPVIRQ